MPSRRIFASGNPSRMILGSVRVAATLLVAWAAVHPSRAQQLPPPPVPSENPITEGKRVLGKILFWEEQVSSHDTMACGGCHRSINGGTDPRTGIHPGPDLLTGTPDDVFGSPGVVRTDTGGNPLSDLLFGLGVQITPRASVTPLGAAYPAELFWDGRARSTFLNPETGATSIVAGGALENQAMGPILSSVEMAYAGRSWSDVRSKLGRALPLRDATDLPSDVEAALAVNPSYSDLFRAAFGDPAITAERIAFAVATYERTLTPNQTPWDSFVAGNPSALTPGQTQGWNFFRNSPCQVCHTPPLFATANQPYRNIGLRPPADDPGRQTVTGLTQDRGRFKVPTLRNTGLRSTHMHNGRIGSVSDAVLWYRPNNPARFTDNLDPILPVGVPPQVLPALVDFLTNGLTDPRVASESFPFDHPTIHGGDLPVLNLGSDRTTLSWPVLSHVQRYNVYRGDIEGLRIPGPDGLPSSGYGTCISQSDPDPADGVFADADRPEAGHGYFYLKSVIDGHGEERGLGATSEGKARQVITPCPPPSVAGK